MSAILRIEGKDGTQTFEIQNTCSIGRSADNQICLKDDTAVSRHHALIRKQEHEGKLEYWLIDMGSANGSRLNSKTVIGPARLKDGDEIKIGETKFCLTIPPLTAEEQDEYEKTFVAHTQLTAFMAKMVILVCDIRNFTRIGELLAPDLLARFIGSWFRNVAEIIVDKKGVVDKYIGDAVMAYWPIDEAKPVESFERAMAAAHKIQALAKSTTVPGNDRFEFGVGIGIHQGLVYSGAIGPQDHPDSTIMGDAVTVAFRLESVCKVTKMPIVVSADIYKVLEGEYKFVSLGEVKLKGKTKSPESFGLETE